MVPKQTLQEQDDASSRTVLIYDDRLTGRRLVGQRFTHMGEEGNGWFPVMVQSRRGIGNGVAATGGNWG